MSLKEALTKTWSRKRSVTVQFLVRILDTTWLWLQYLHLLHFMLKTFSGYLKTEHWNNLSKFRTRNYWVFYNFFILCITFRQTTSRHIKDKYRTRGDMDMYEKHYFWFNISYSPYNYSSVIIRLLCFAKKVYRLYRRPCK